MNMPMMMSLLVRMVMTNDGEAHDDSEDEKDNYAIGDEADDDDYN